MKSRVRRGFSLAAALLSFLVAFVVLSTVATTSTFSLRMAVQSENGQTAQRLANSIVHQGVAAIVKDPSFHTDLNLLEGEASAQLTFQKDRGIPHCTNNWEGDSPLGWGRGVPRGMIHLIGVATCRGVERRVETLVDMPVYPMTVACSGPLTLENSTVGSVKDEILDQDLAVILAAPLGPANVGSNSAKAGSSIELLQNSHITGFVQSCGGIKNQGARVDGEIRELWPKPSELPEMSAATFDPRRPDPSDENVIYTKLPAGTYADLDVNAHNVVSGNLEVNGALNLNDSLLFVDGDLTVKGGLNGQGALGVRGRVKISGASHLRAQSRVAVVADGNITLLGEDRASQRFEGILYSKGTIEVQSVTLLGSCIQNAPAGSPANQIGVVITDSNVFFSQRTSAPSFNPPVDTLLSAVGGSAAIEDVKGPSSRENDSLVGKTTVRRNRAGAPAGPGNQRERNNSWTADDVIVLRMQFDAQNNPRFARTGWGMANQGPELNGDGSPLIHGYYFGSPSALIDQMGQGAGPYSEAELFAMLADTTHSYPPSGKNNVPNIHARGVDLSGGYNEFGDGCDVNEEAFRAALRDTVNTLIQRSQKLRNRSPDPKSFYSLDPSRFLSRSRAVHLHYWREF